MNRRNFLTSLAAFGALLSIPAILKLKAEKKFLIL
jgi:hypothetical protein